MGCDIHASVEIRQRESDDWWTIAVNCDHLPRDYAMFSCLVDGHGRDYRNSGGIAPAKGLPTNGAVARDVAEGIQELCCAVAYADHTFSWLTPAEFRSAIALYRERTLHDPPPEYVAMSAYLDALEPHGTIRFVFGFDN